MGSRIMHAIIANRMADLLSVEDRTTFIVGSVAPDAVSPKDLSHFFDGEIEDFTRFVDYTRFLHKYGSQADNPYILGYFAHLIADDIWLKGFNLPWLRNRMEANPGLYQTYHNDFRMLNGKLLEYYGCADELRKTFGRPSAIFDLDEVSSGEVEQLIPEVIGDMEYEEDVVRKQLNVFTFDQIVGYIETSIEVGALKMSRLPAQDRTRRR